jgi:isocitrate dehydrogenase
MPTIKAPAMVYIKGEEMTRYAMGLILEQWIHPYVDTAAWQVFDLSCKHRDATKDQVLKDIIGAGSKVGAIFKEPTITPTADQAKEMGLSKAWGSPNGALRRGWNGFAISRDTIHVPGLKLGYAKPVMFDRHAVGGEYGAGAKEVGAGKLVTKFIPKDGGPEVIVDERELKDKVNAAVTYHNPYDNVRALARHHFARALEAGVTPHIVTKKTVFKWQEPFWQMMKEVFDKEFAEKFNAKGLLKSTGGKLSHMLSDAATMKIIAWKEGGFSMVAHNYDGDVLTDEISQFHRSPAFLDSCLVGVREDGSIIKEFEASHGTVSDMEAARLAGKRTSLNPLGMVDALVKAMNHSAKLAGKESEMLPFTRAVYQAVCEVLVSPNGTEDVGGKASTEEFVAHVGKVIKQAPAREAKAS